MKEKLEDVVNDYMDLLIKAMGTITEEDERNLNYFRQGLETGLKQAIEYYNAEIEM